MFVFYTVIAPEILLLAAIGLALIPIGLFIFTLGERYAIHAGKLKRSG